MNPHFIHIPKNGGMTIRRCPELKKRLTFSTASTLKNAAYKRELLETMDRYGEHHGFEHARWRDLNEYLRMGPCLAIVRNPWSKVVSRYTFLVRMFDINNQRVVEGPHYKRETFMEFLEERHIWGGKKFFWHRAIKGWFPQKDHVTDEDGVLRADILRLEHLNEDVNAYFGLDITLESRNISNIKHIDYRTFYDDATYKIVEDWYADDIEFFGFTFDGPATKNIWNQ